MRIIIVIVLCLLAWPAHGQSITSNTGRGVLMPPYEYVRPYEGRTIIERRNQSELKIDCPIPTALNQRIFGCSYNTKAPPLICVIYLLTDDELTEFGYAADMVIQHEIAHCNGWPNTHPDGIFWPAMQRRQ